MSLFAAPYFSEECADTRTHHHTVTTGHHHNLSHVVNVIIIMSVDLNSIVKAQATRVPKFDFVQLFTTDRQNWKSVSPRVIFFQWQNKITTKTLT